MNATVLFIEGVALVIILFLIVIVYSRLKNEIY